MKVPNKNFCILPWISIEASPIGTVRPCCLAEDELRDNKGNKFMLSKTSIDEIRQSDDMYNLRKQFLLDKKPETCKKCWAVEDSGGKSKRQYTLERLEHIGIDTNWNENAKALMFVDFKLGNICNLKCRICGSWSSSTYATEEIKQVPVLQRKSTFAYKMIEQGQWPRQSPNFWKELDQYANELRYLEFTGGEPFMIHEHFDFLKTLVDKGIAHNIEIHYNTNGTHYPEQAIDIWKNFKLVEIAFSIDDIKARFEYQRKNAEWELVNTNIVKFTNLKKQLDNITLQVCSTVSIYNVFYLEGLANWIDKQDFDFIYWNLLHEIWYNSIASLPIQAKQKIKSVLENAKVSQYHKREFGKIIQFMINGKSSDGEELIKSINKLDKIRDEKIFDNHFELAEVLGMEINRPT